MGKRFEIPCLLCGERPAEHIPRGESSKMVCGVCVQDLGMTLSEESPARHGGATARSGGGDTLTPRAGWTSRLRTPQRPEVTVVHIMVEGGDCR